MIGSGTIRARSSVNASNGSGQAAGAFWLLWISVGWLTGGLVTQAAPISSEAARSHWAFVPPRDHALPAVRRNDWCQSDIDRFVLAGLESAELAPSPQADRRTLIRRATFDLLGLPPTPDEVATFEADSAPDAFERLVERLLASPHYGERWGRHWLDVARYADNKGYVFFEEKTYPWAYTYRDYVVRAFNEDLSFDQFLLQQLAADQLDLGADRRPLAAMGFLTVGDHLINNTHDIVDDRIDVLTRGLLGLTVACARCHDHKYDPVSQGDYYGLYGVLRSSHEPLVPPLFSPPDYNEEYEGFELELIARDQELHRFVAEKHRDIVEGGRRRVGEYLMAAHAARNQPITENFMIIADKGDVNPTVLMRWRLYLERLDLETHPVWAPWHWLSGLSESNFAAQAADKIRTALDPAHPIRLNSRIATLLAGAPPKSLQELSDRYGEAFRRVEGQWQESLKAAKELSQPAPRGLPLPEDEQLRAVLYGADSPADVPATMDWGFISLLPDRASQGEFQKLITRLEQWMMNGPQAPPRAMVLKDAPVAFEPRIFQRGNPNRPGPVVPRQYLSFFNTSAAPFQQGSGRLELAQRIVDPQNPLTARVLVNRVWLHHFGTPLVATPSDFGVRSDPPSHPELLDYLALYLQRHRWSLKSLHRLIMRSAVYQQTSVDRSEAARLDPENRRLWRMNRRRHDYETLRDSLLAVSGKLDRSVGGRPVDAQAPRRTLYVFIDRMDLPSLYSTFDFPSPASSCPQRMQTTVAPQMLYLMNNPFLEKLAEAVANRVELARAQDPGARVEMLYQLVFGRPASRADQALAARYLSESGKDGWRQLVHALLMTNEFAFVD
ncbi:MAG: DUF1553 domain-containing protein [Verrucomicrobiales bacterium]|nr:DUF1553 domain-containing protein [Verrucomicrobiales bacterium]